MSTTQHRVGAQLHQAAKDAQRIADVMELKEQLRAEFGPRGWSIVYSSAGRWWAFRGPMKADRVNETSDVDAGSAEELRERLLVVEADMKSPGRHAAPDEDRSLFAPWDAART
ncbi:hypothetical protein ACFY4C_42055 [Actinomadura viridis]|uniref:hypothetical protein n=1 Tax=Actinomadura viridis TaxID=58110 RepID=UPI0036CFB340